MVIDAKKNGDSLAVAVKRYFHLDLNDKAKERNLESMIEMGLRKEKVKKRGTFYSDPPSPFNKLASKKSGKEGSVWNRIGRKC